MEINQINKEMKLGVSTYTWPWAVGIEGFNPKKELNVFDILIKANELGVEVVQLADKPLLSEIDEKTLFEIKSIANKMGISLEVGTRGVEEKNLLKYLDIAKKLNSKIVRTVIPSLDNNSLSSIKKIISQFRKEKVTIALENHDEHSSDDLISFIKKIDSNNLGICLDTMNSIASLESPKTTIQILGPYAVSLHIKDFEIFRMKHKLGFIVEGRPAGQGRLDIQWILDYFKRNGKCLNIILEQWTPFSETIQKTIKKEEEWALISIEYLKRIIGKGLISERKINDKQY